MSAEWSEEDRRTAYHEAGHAVLAIGMELPIESVTLEPTERLAGAVLFGEAPVGAHTLELRKWLIKRLVVTQGGGIAEWWFYNELHPEGDIMDAVTSSVSKDGEDSFTIASLLRIPADKRSDVIDIALAEALGDVVKHWPCIVALAEALRERKTLTGQQALDILDGAVPDLSHSERAP